MRLLPSCCLVLYLTSSGLCRNKAVKVSDVYYKNIRCNFSEKFAFSNYSCFAKSYSRTISTINMIVNFKTPLTSFSVSVSNSSNNNYQALVLQNCCWIKWSFLPFSEKAALLVYYKYGMIYREVMHTPKLDWCQLMDNTIENLFFKSLIEVFKENFHGFVHECPYEVCLKLKFSDVLGFMKLW